MEKSSFGVKILSFSWIAWFALPFFIIVSLVFLNPSLVAMLLSDSRFLSAFYISLLSAIAVVVITPFFAIPTAFFLAYSDFKFKSFLEAILIDIPQTFPPVAVGVIYLTVLGSNSPLNLAFTFAAVVIAKLFVSAPFTTSYLLRKFRDVKASRLDLVARSLGASEKDLLFKILIPLSKKEAVAGLTLSWARAMGEFGGSLIFAGVIAYKTEILPTYTSRVVDSNVQLAIAATAVMTLFALTAIIAVRKALQED